METIQISKDQDIRATFEDLFTGGYEAHKVEGKENCYLITKVEEN